MAITIRDVAKEAGVSIAAVSKVLHGRGESVRVSETRAAVIREVAERLKYRPNALARNLRSSRTHTVGLIFENFYNISGGPLYYLHLLDGVGSVFFSNHYRLTILPEISLDSLEDSLGDGQLEGVIWCKLARDEAAQKLLAQCPIPVVALNASEPTPESAGRAVFVNCDNRQGMELAVDHLVGLGHRRIAFLNEFEEEGTPDAFARREGFVEAMQARGLEVPPTDLLSWGWMFDDFAGWWSRQEGAGAEGVTAVACWSERSAGQLLKRAQEAGVRVPDELSVVGFDSTQYCDTTSPNLTAVRQPIFDMARHASETLLRLIAGDRPETNLATFPCTLDLRASTASPREENP